MFEIAGFHLLQLSCTSEPTSGKIFENFKDKLVAESIFLSGNQGRARIFALLL